MKKSILKSLQPKTKSLFRFKNSDSKYGAPDTTVLGNTTDPTTVTSTTITH